MSESHVWAFVLGAAVGAVLMSIPMRNQIDYWKGAYCIHTPYDLYFCEEYRK